MKTTTTQVRTIKVPDMKRARKGLEAAGWELRGLGVYGCSMWAGYRKGFQALKVVSR